VYEKSALERSFYIFARVNSLVETEATIYGVQKEYFNFTLDGYLHDKFRLNSMYVTDILQAMLAAKVVRPAHWFY